MSAMHVLMICINLNNIAILNICGVNYRCSNIISKWCPKCIAKWWFDWKKEYYKNKIL